LTSSGAPIAAAPSSFGVEEASAVERTARFFERLLEVTFWWRYKNNFGFTTYKRVAQLMREQRFTEALSVCRWLSAEPSTSATFVAAARTAEAQLLLHFGFPDEARAVLARVDLIGMPAPARAQHATICALIARERHDFVQMLHHADDALSFGRSKNAHYTRAIALKNLNRVADAIAELDRGLELAPLDGALRLARGAYLFLVDGSSSAAVAEVRSLWDSATIDRGDERSWLVNVAWSAAVVHDDDRAFAALAARAADADDAGARYLLRFLEVERDFHRLRADPRMAALTTSLRQRDRGA
jgi:hypothetical protein